MPRGSNNAFKSTEEFDNNKFRKIGGLSLIKNIKSKESPLSEKEQISFIKGIFVYNHPDSSFVYPGNAHLYKKMVNAPEYYPFHVEKRLLEKYRNLLYPYFGKYITDYGCGNGEKAEITLKHYPKSITYIAADYAPDMIASAKSRIAKYQHIKTGQDFILGGNDFDIAKNLENNTYLWLGITANNYGDYLLTEKIKNMGNNNWKKGNHIILTFATEAKTEEVRQKRIAAYDNTPTRDFVAASLKNLGLDSKEFDYKVMCDSVGNIQLGFVSQVNSISLPNGETITIEKGKFYPFHTNRVFSREFFKKLLKNAGASEKLFIEEDGVVLVVAKKSPENIEKYKKQIRNILLGVLMTSTAFGVHSGVSHHRQHKELKRAQLELVRGKLLSDYGYPIGNETNFGIDTSEELLSRLHELSEILYSDLEDVFDLSSSNKNKRHLLLLIQSHLLDQKTDGSYVKFKEILENKNGERRDVLTSFVKKYRASIAAFGGFDKMRPLEKAFEPTLDLPGEIRGVHGIQNSGGDGMFNANIEHTSPYTKFHYPKGININDRSIQEAKNNFDLHKDKFSLAISPRNMFVYRTDDGKFYQVILIDRNGIDDKGDYFSGPYLLASETELNFVDINSRKDYSLTLGKKIIEDYCKYWK